MKPAISDALLRRLATVADDLEALLIEQEAATAREVLQLLVDKADLEKIVVGLYDYVTFEHPVTKPSQVLDDPELGKIADRIVADAARQVDR